MANNQHRAVAGEPTSFLPRTLGHANYPPSLAPPSAFVWQGLTAQEQTYEQGPSYYGPPTHAYTVPSPPAATLGTRQTVHNPSNAVEPGRNQMRRIRQPPMADSSASESDNGRMDPRKYSQPYPSYGESNANSMVRERGRQRPDPRQSFSDHSNSSSPHRRIPQHAPPNPHGVTFAQGGPHGQSPQSNPMTPQGRNRVPARTSFSDEALMRLRRSGGQHANMSLRSRGFSDIQIQLHELGFDPAQFQSDAEISDFLVARGESVPQVQGSSRPHPTHDAVTRYLASLPSLRDRRLALIEKLVASFPAQAATLRKPEARSTLAQDQVLVFVDYSNIKLGLVNCVRVRCSLPRTTLVSGVRMSFVSLAWVMLRGRKLSSGFVGTSKSGHRRSDPGLTEAIGLGFEVLELDRRPLAADESGDLSGAGASSSAPASGPSPARGSRPPRMKERYVDELIQQRMGDAILDASAKFAAGRGPTMVLASGDGNEAEFTAGFVPKLRQALRFGWRVEVLSFRQSLSGRYQELADEFPGLVTIILLDEYMAELLDE